MITKQLISDLKAGDSVDTYFILKSIDLNRGKSSEYLRMEFSDKSGAISSFLFEPAQISYVREKFKTGDFVQIKGGITEYKGTPQLKISDIRIPDDNIDLKMLLPTAPINAAEYWERLKDIINEISDPDFRKLVESVFSDDAFAEKFKRAPGGKSWHHPYLSGLLEHTVNVTEMVLFLSKRYKNLNRDVMICGALLHDAGKTEEYEYGNVIDFSDRGRLLGHLTIGAEIIGKKASEIPGFPIKKADLLKHMILSHHGQKDFGSPVVPQLTEAFAVYYADELDSKINAVSSIIEKDRLKGSRWSSYVRNMERSFYLDNLK